jgi:hypothetical protein
MDNNEAQWQYTGTEKPSADMPQEKKKSSISWSASEYIAHEKNQGWFLLLIGGAVLVSGIFYLLYRDILTSLAVLTAASCAAFFAHRQPQPKNYELSSVGLQAGDLLHKFSEFKSFSVVEEGALDSIWLKRLARFKPPVVIYFAPEDENKIIEMLSNFLPHEQRQLDAIDRFSKRIRF